MRHLLKAVRSVKYSPYSESITTSMVVPLNDSAASFCRPTCVPLACTSINSTKKT